jgi:hypothetical protein
LRPIRILHVLAGLNAGGVETRLLRVPRKPDRRHFQTGVVVHAGKPGVCGDELRGPGRRIILRLRPPRPWTYARNFIGILRRQGEYDVVHGHSRRFGGPIVRLGRPASHFDSLAATTTRDRLTVPRGR